VNRPRLDLVVAMLAALVASCSVGIGVRDHTRRDTADVLHGSPSTTITFEADTSLFANPETGPFWEFQNSGSTFRNPPLADYTALGVPQGVRPHGVSTIYGSYWIGDFFSTDLSQKFLDQVAGDLTTARASGFKLVLGFHYNCSWQDPPAAQIVRHVRQLAPILATHADALAAMDWGMAGPCGEYGISQPTYNLGDPSMVCPDACDRIRWVNDNTRAIIRAWLDATPRDRMILFNADAKRMFLSYDGGLHPDPQPAGPYVPGAPGDTTLTPTEAFSGSDRSRIGFENQCFLTDVHPEDPTYRNRPVMGPTAYMAIEGLYTPQLLFPDTACGYHPSAQELLAEINAGHWDLVSAETVINRIFVGSGWSTPAVQDFFRKIGYRYRLVSAQLPGSATHGTGAYQVNLTVTNDNGGMLFNPRTIELILRHRSTGARYVTTYDGDGKGNRTLFPPQGGTATWTITASLSSVRAGPYDVILNLPDPYPSIHDNPLFSIRLANVGTWEPGTGYNVLARNVMID
jgi:hypothetical protein